MKNEESKIEETRTTKYNATHRALNKELSKNKSLGPRKLINDKKYNALNNKTNNKENEKNNKENTSKKGHLFDNLGRKKAQRIKPINKNNKNRKSPYSNPLYKNNEEDDKTNNELPVKQQSDEKTKEISGGKNEKLNSSNVIQNKKKINKNKNGKSPNDLKDKSKKAVVNGMKKLLHTKLILLGLFGLIFLLLFLFFFIIIVGSDYSYGSSNYDNDSYWWPVGSDETEVINGKIFAKEMPYNTIITSVFGKRDAPTQGASTDHGAIDIAPIDGASGVHNIIASKDGLVIMSQSYAGYGNCVIISHDDGNFTLYAHMADNSLIVKTGDKVLQGQVIGKMGSTGVSTGTHLHFEMRLAFNTQESRVDPLDYVSLENPRPMPAFVNGAGFDLLETSLTKQEFISLMNNYSYSDSYDTNFKKIADEIYIYSLQYNINPELVVVTAQTEMSFKKCDGWYNFWGIGISNGQGCDDGGHFKTMKSGIKGYAELIHSYTSSDSSFYKQIITRAKTRKKANCQVGGYGYPNTIEGMQSIWSWLGDTWNSSNCQYLRGFMDEGINNKKYTEAYYNNACNGNNRKTNVCEQNDYTIYQLIGKKEARKAIFKIG